VLIKLRLCLLLPTIRGFKIASLNITSLPKHIDELRVAMKNNEIDVLAINESRMDNSIAPELIHGYNWVSKVEIDLGVVLVSTLEIQ
jgi:exonuclease III